VPPIFVGIAYDSGGVASGPMTATFVLAFAQGAANAIPTANVMVDGFGVIAMVAMMPLVAIQILGLIYKMKAGEDGQSQSYEEAQSS
jgi:NADH:ubiquinone oxidoreductase subunit 3 (subunit A)